MKIPYSKYFTSPHDLVLLLKNRGLEIKNKEKATAYIANIGYYRLSSYCFPLFGQWVFLPIGKVSHFGNRKFQL